MCCCCVSPIPFTVSAYRRLLLRLLCFALSSPLVTTPATMDPLALCVSGNYMHVKNKGTIARFLIPGVIVHSTVDDAPHSMPRGVCVWPIEPWWQGFCSS